MRKNRLVKYIQTLLVILFFSSPHLFALEKNQHFKTEKDLISYFKEHTGNPVDDSIVDISKIDNTSKWIINVHLSSIDIDDEIIFNWRTQEVESVLGKFAGITSIHYEKNKEKRGSPDPATYNKEKISVIAKHLIQDSVKKSFNKRHEKALKEYKKKDMKWAGRYSLKALSGDYIEYYPIQEENVDKYNDFGFFLEQSGQYNEAIKLLQKVVTAFPNRTVTYINLGDANYGLNNLGEAILAYNPSSGNPWK